MKDGQFNDRRPTACDLPTMVLTVADLAADLRPAIRRHVQTSIPTKLEIGWAPSLSEVLVQHC